MAIANAHTFDEDPIDRVEQACLSTTPVSPPALIDCRVTEPRAALELPYRSGGYCLPFDEAAIVEIREHGPSVRARVDGGLGWVDSPGDGIGSEWIEVAAGTTLELMFKGDSRATGSVTVNPLPDDDRVGELAARFTIASERANDPDLAVSLLEAARLLWQHQRNVRNGAFATYQMAQYRFRSDDYLAAIPHFEGCFDTASALTHAGAARCADTISTSIDPALQARCANGLGLVHRQLGRYDLAQNYFENAACLANLGDDRYTAAAAINNQALIARHEGELTQAKHLFEAAIDAYTDAGETNKSAAPRFNLAALEAILGHSESALHSYDSALELVANTMEQGPDVDPIKCFRAAQVLVNMAVLLRRLLAFDEARRSASLASAIFDKQSNELWMARARKEIGLQYLDIGDRHQALRLLIEVSEKLQRRKLNNRTRGEVELAMARALPDDRYERAEAAYQQFVADDSSEIELAASTVLFAIAQSLRDQDHRERDRWLRRAESLESLRESSPYYDARLALAFAQVAYDSGNPERAQAGLDKTVRYFEQNGMVLEHLQAVTLQTELMIDRGASIETIRRVAAPVLDASSRAANRILGKRQQILFLQLTRRLTDLIIRAELKAGRVNAGFNYALQQYNRVLESTRSGSDGSAYLFNYGLDTDIVGAGFAIEDIVRATGPTHRCVR